VDPAAWGVIGTAVGALASIGTTWLTNRNSANLQASAKAAERVETQRAFQRQTLLELQDAFHDAIRLAARVHLEDCKAERRAHLGVATTCLMTSLRMRAWLTVG
jgi:hypothetical protein